MVVSGSNTAVGEERYTKEGGWEWAAKLSKDTYAWVRQDPESGVLYFEYPPNPDDIAGVLLESEQLSIEAEQYLSDKRDRDACRKMISSVARMSLVLMQQRAKIISSKEMDPHTDLEALARQRDEKALAGLRNQLKAIRQFLISTAQLRAIPRFILGMLLGVIVLIIGYTLWDTLLGIDVIFVIPEEMPETEFEIAILALIAAYWGGTLGAILSVLQRFTAGMLNLDYRLERGTLFLLGITRPIIGAAFGVVTFSFIQSELVPITVPADTITSIYFFGSLGLLAGFSERFMQGMFATAQNKVQGDTSLEGAKNNGALERRPS
jgi:hypothetical protein